MSVKVITAEKRVIITDGDSEFLDSKIKIFASIYFNFI